MDIREAINAGKAGLWRGYVDGYTKWSKKNICSLFFYIDLNSLEVRGELLALEHQGLIKFVGSDDLYMEVLDAPWYDPETRSYYLKREDGGRDQV